MLETVIVRRVQRQVLEKCISPNARVEQLLPTSSAMRTIPPTVLALLPGETVEGDSRRRAHPRRVLPVPRPELPGEAGTARCTLSGTDEHGLTPLTLRLLDGEDVSVQLFAVDLLTTPSARPGSEGVVWRCPQSRS